MSPQQRYSDEQLREMVQNDMTKSEILEETGYNRKTLNERLKGIGVQKLRKLQRYELGGASMSISHDTLQEFVDEQGFEQDEEVYFRVEVVDGNLQVSLYGSQLVFEEEEGEVSQ